MLKESGNLLTENIPITKDLLDFAKIWRLWFGDTKQRKV